LSVEGNNQSDLRTNEVTSEDDLSDLSDEDEYLYPEGGEGEQLKLIRLTPSRTTNPKIRKLFSNTDRVIIHLNHAMLKHDNHDCLVILYKHKLILYGCRCSV